MYDRELNGSLFVLNMNSEDYKIYAQGYKIKRLSIMG